MSENATVIWRGEQSILPYGSRVTILATDPECPDLRGAAWVRWWPEGSDHPRYRSCDLSDLELSGKEEQA